MKQSSQSHSLLIRNGHLIDPVARVDALMDILLRDGQVSEIAPPNKIRGGADEKFDAKGLIVAPGFIDLHAHLREPGQSYKETIASGTAAAASVSFQTGGLNDWFTVGQQQQHGGAGYGHAARDAVMARPGSVVVL